MWQPNKSCFPTPTPPTAYERFWKAVEPFAVFVVGGMFILALVQIGLISYDTRVQTRENEAQEARVHAVMAEADAVALAKANEPLTEDELRDGGRKMFMDNREFFVRFVTLTNWKRNEYDKEQGYDDYEKWLRRQREEGNWTPNSQAFFSEAKKHAIRDINSR